MSARSSSSKPTGAAWVRHMGKFYWIEGGRSHDACYNIRELRDAVGTKDHPTAGIMQCTQGPDGGLATEGRQKLYEFQQIEAKRAQKAANRVRYTLHTPRLHGHTTQNVT